jgi:hypothetical protein
LKEHLVSQPPPQPTAGAPLESAQYASAASLGDNPHYIGERLKFTKAGELEFAFTQTDGIIAQAVLRSFSRAAAVFAPFAFIAVIVGLMRDSSEESAYGYTSSVADKTPNTTLLVIGLVLALITFIVIWFLPYRQPLSEWQMLVDGRAPAADSAYSAIYMTLRQRGIPVEVSARRIRSQLGAGGSRNYLLVRQRPFTAYVGVFAYGNALYLGWSLWRVQSPLSVLWLNISTKVLAVLTQDGTGFRKLLNAEPAKALREAVHSATREGVQVASEGMSVPLQYAFGQEVPVTELGVNPERGDLPGNQYQQGQVQQQQAPQQAQWQQQAPQQQMPVQQQVPAQQQAPQAQQQMPAQQPLQQQAYLQTAVEPQLPHSQAEAQDEARAEARAEAEPEVQAEVSSQVQAEAEARAGAEQLAAPAPASAPTSWNIPSAPPQQPRAKDE